MNAMLTCTACGSTSLHVKRRLVELKQPWRMVHDIESGKPMPERFVVEPRCTDPEACRSRQEVKA